MPLRTFEGPSVGDLLAQIRAELGSEAVILDVRQRPHGVALTAADPVTADTYKVGPTGASPNRPKVAATRPLPDTSNVRSTLMPPNRSNGNATPPRATQASPLLAPLKATHAKPAPTRSRFGWWGLRSRTHCVQPARPLVLAFVGPTGAGKTTTIAKLAAHPRLFGGAQVGIRNLDTYRVGATEQIAQHASLSNVPVAAAHRLKDLVRARHALRSCQVVLIDCPGRGPQFIATRPR